MKITFKRKNNNRHLILFVHGLTGDMDTFKHPEENQYFHEFFTPSINKITDIGYMQYHTEVLSKKSIRFLIFKALNLFKQSPIYNLNIEELSVSAVHELKHVLEDYESVNFICHSMGGLVIKGALIKDESLVKKTAFYITLATPHRGTNIARFMNGLNRQIKSLEENSQIINHLTHKYETIKDKIARHYYRATDDSWVKPKPNAFPIYEDEYTSPVDTTHTNIAKLRRDVYLGPLIYDINNKIEDYLSIKKDTLGVEVDSEVKDIVLSRLDELESKIDKIHLNCSANNAQTINFVPALERTQGSQLSDTQITDKKGFQVLNTEVLNIDAGFTVKDTVFHSESYFILLTNHDKTENIVVKYIHQNGIDIQFGIDGQLSIDFNSNNCNMNKILIKEDSLFIVGESVQDGSFAISICKSNLRGEIDSSYADNGLCLIKTSNEHQYANDAILLGNNIITAGASFQSKKALVTCINQDGRLVEEFGADSLLKGEAEHDHVWANCICKYDDESFIVAGKSGSWVIFVSRFKNDGKRDSTFRYGGTILHQYFLRVESLKVQSDGKILVAGVGNEGRVIRLLPNGQLDKTFANEGVLEVLTNERSEVLTLKLFDDDSFVVGGSESDGNSFHQGIIAFYTKDGFYDNDKITSGYMSFKINNKTTVHNLVIYNDSYVSTICNYNIDFSQNKRTKVAVRNFVLKK